MKRTPLSRQDAIDDALVQEVQQKSELAKRKSSRSKIVRSTSSLIPNSDALNANGSVSDGCFARGGWIVSQNSRSVLRWFSFSLCMWFALAVIRKNERGKSISNRVSLTPCDKRRSVPLLSPVGIIRIG